MDSSATSNSGRPAHQVWQFADCEFDEIRRELRVRGHPMDLEVKPLEALRYLLLHAGEVVTKEQLLEAVWPDVAVADGSVATAISKLRKVLGKREQIITTIPRVGYRLEVPVRATEPVPSRHPPAVPDSSATPARRRAGHAYAALVIAVAVALAVIVTRSSFPKSGISQARAIRVAVLPFENLGSDSQVDYLRFALADEVATVLSRIPGITVRPFAVTSKYTARDLDFAKVGREARAEHVLTGRFTRAERQLHITLEVIDAASERTVWRDAMGVPAGNLIAAKIQMTLRLRSGLAPVFGVAASDFPAAPKSEQAYSLFLKSAAVPFDPGPNAGAMAMLERSVQLDPEYAPAWLALARRYYVEARYARGSALYMERYDRALEHTVALAPDYPAAAAGLIVSRVERGELIDAHRRAQGLLRRRPDSVEAHFALSYVLRFAGLLDAAASHCESALLLDAQTQTAGLRSCAFVFLQRADYPRVLNYLELDRDSEWGKALKLELLVRQGKQREALGVGIPAMPQWTSYGLLRACLERRSQSELSELAARIRPSADPEVSYLASGHLAHCGLIDSAAALLRHAIDGGYCSTAAFESDPMFARLRARESVGGLRAAATACRAKLVAASGYSGNVTGPLR